MLCFYNFFQHKSAESLPWPPEAWESSGQRVSSHAFLEKPLEKVQLETAIGSLLLQWFSVRLLIYGIPDLGLFSRCIEICIQYTDVYKQILAIKILLIFFFFLLPKTSNKIAGKNFNLWNVKRSNKNIKERLWKVTDKWPYLTRQKGNTNPAV